MVLKLPFLFFKSLSILRSDKKIILYSLIPIIIGFICYYFIGNYVFTDLFELGRVYIKQHFEITGWMSNLIYGLLIIFFGIFVNFSFFIFISIIAGPFNDIISSLVASKYQLKDSSNNEFESMIKRLPKIIKNEAQKIFLLITLSILNIVLSFFVPPVAVLVASILFAISFLDYSWSRNELDIKGCLSDLRRGFLSYLLGGLVFIFLVSIPILNLFFLPLAVVFFTVIHCELRGDHA